MRTVSRSRSALRRRLPLAAALGAVALCAMPSAPAHAHPAAPIRAAAGVELDETCVDHLRWHAQDMRRAGATRTVLDWAPLAPLADGRKTLRLPRDVGELPWDELVRIVAALTNGKDASWVNNAYLHIDKHPAGSPERAFWTRLHRIYSDAYQAARHAATKDAWRGKLRADEVAYFDRWGLAPEEPIAFRELDRKVGIRKRMRELVAAARSGDYVAWQLVSLDLGHRCNGGERVSRADCSAFVYWHEAVTHLLRNRRPSELATRWTLTPHDVLGPADRLTDIGHRFELGIGGPRDLRVASFFYSYAHYSGNTPGDQAATAAYRLGRMIEAGFDPGLGNDAMHFYRWAAERGHPAAAYMLSALERDPERRNRLLETAAEGGIADAAYRVAHMIETGQHRTPDGVAKLFRYYRAAALQGHVPAMSGVARAHANGWGTAANRALAEDWWTRAARAGDPEAAYRVAVEHSRRGDHSGGMAWLRRAAEGGHAQARRDHAQARANGHAERSIGGALMKVLRLVGDVAAEAQRQRQAEVAAQEALYAATFAALAEQRSGGISGAIIVSDDEAARAAERAAQDAMRAAEASERAAKERAWAEFNARHQAQATANAAALEARRTAALIACHGSLERARTAKATCQ